MWLGILIWFALLTAEAAKYQQDDYTVDLTRVQAVNFDRSYFTDISCSLVYFNRTYRAINASGHLIKDLGINIKVQFQLYKFLSNEYRFFPITIEIDGCKNLERDDFGVIESLQKSTNFKIRCPVKKGLLKITYGKINFNNFPPFIPPGEYKAEIKFIENLIFFYELHAYFKIEELKDQWNNLLKKII